MIGKSTGLAWLLQCKSRLLQESIRLTPHAHSLTRRALWPWDAGELCLVLCKALVSGKNKGSGDVLEGSVVRYLLASVENRCSIPDVRISHVLWSNHAPAPQPLSLFWEPESGSYNHCAHMPQPLRPEGALAPALQQEKPPQ